MALTVIYTVYDRDSGDLLVKGTTKECAAHFGISSETFRNRASDTSKRRRWNVETSEPMSSAKAEAISNWDSFCAPLRKKYGIKVWRKENAAD